MKIQYLAFVRLPTEKAHGLQIVKTCEALAGAGATVELVIPGRATIITEDPYTFYGAQRSFTFTTVQTPDYVSAGRLGFLLSLTWFAEAVKWRKSFWQADVVYSRDHLILLQYLLLGRRLVFEAHQKPSFFSSIVARCAFRVVVISQALKDAYERVGVRADNIILAPDAAGEPIALSRPDARRLLGWDPAARIVLYAGSLSPRKGAEVFAEAARLLPEVTVVVAGAVGARTNVWAQAPVRLMGQIPPAQVAIALRAADVLVVPSSAKDEDSALFGSPMKLFESLASGTPLVASRVPAVTSIVPDTAVYLVPADDPRALANGIQTALSDPRASERAMRAQEVARGYSWQERARRIREGLKGV